MAFDGRSLTAREERNYASSNGILVHKVRSPAPQLEGCDKEEHAHTHIDQHTDQTTANLQIHVQEQSSEGAGRDQPSAPRRRRGPGLHQLWSAGAGMGSGSSASPSSGAGAVGTRLGGRPRSAPAGCWCGTTCTSPAEEHEPVELALVGEALPKGSYEVIVWIEHT